MSWLDMAAGAGAGLDKMLADNLAREQWERQQAERERSARADEAFRSKDLEGRADERRLTREQATTQQARVERRFAVDDDRAAWNDVPGGSIVPPAEMKRSVELGSMRPEAFDASATIPSRIAMRQGAPAALAENESVIKLRDNPAEIAAKANRAAAEAQRDAVGSDRDAQRQMMTDHYRNQDRIAQAGLDLRREFGPPTITIADEDNPARNRVIPRNQLPEGGGRGPEAAATREKINAYNTTLNDIKLLKDGAFTPQEWAAALGPWDANVAGKLRENLGITALGSGGGQRGTLLRTALARLKANSSFDTGGKQFTGTENELISAFIAASTNQPDVAQLRLAEAERAMRSSLSTLGAGPQRDAEAGGDTGAAPPPAAGRPRLRFNPATGRAE